MIYTRLLRQGSRGNDVKELQSTLTEKGFNTRGIDGIFGRNTRKAVEHFQVNKNLVVDGLVGPATVNAINANGKTAKGKYQVLQPNRQTTIVKIPHKNISEIKLMVADNRSNLQSLPYMRNQNKMDLAINGGLFWYGNGKANPLNLLHKDGKQITAGAYSRFCLLTNKDFSYKFDWYSWNTQRQDIIGGSPSLVINGKVRIDKGRMESSLINNRHPRSSLGMCKDYFYMVVIDGRNASRGLYGMNIRELANYMKSLGCHSAINLDGGGSSRIIDNTGTLNKNKENRAIHNGIGINLI